MTEENKIELEKINTLIAGIKKGFESGKLEFEEVGSLYIAVTNILVADSSNNVKFKYQERDIQNIINGIELCNSRGTFSLDESALLLESVNFFKNYSKKSS